jgi:hypothetical protein
VKRVLAIVAFLSCASTFLASLHVVALQWCDLRLVLAIDVAFPWLAIYGAAAFADAKCWRTRVYITLATTLGYVAGDCLVFLLL